MKMKRLGKVLGIIAASVLLFLIIMVLVLNSFLKSEQFKKLVIGRIETVLNMPVEMGNFRVNVFSGVQIEGFNIKNPQGFPEGYSLKTETIILKYNLYDLLRRKFKIEEIQVIHPDIHLVQKADGTWNLPITSPTPNDKSGKDLPASQQAGMMMIPFIADNVQIIEGNLTWKKVGETTSLSIQNFTIKAKIHSINSFPNMDLNLSINEMDSPITSAIKDIKANLKTSEGLASLDNLSLNISGGSIAMKGDSTLPSKDKEAEYTATISVKDIDLEVLVNQFLPEMQNLLKGVLNADITIKGQGLDAEADITLTIPSLAVQDQFKIDQVKSNIHYANPNFTIQALNMNVFGGNVEGKGTGTLANITNPTFNVNFNMNNIDAGTALTALGQDPSLAQGKLSGNINTSGSISDIKADGKITSDKLTIKKMGNLTDITAPFKAIVTKQNKEINLENFSAKIYGGSVKGSANITFDQNGQPNYSTTLNLSALEAKDALKELTGQTFLTGKAEGNIKLSGKGNDINTITGNTDISLRNGRISSHPIQNILSIVLQMPALRTINFETATVSSTIKDGKVNVRTAQLEDPKLLRFDSKGEIKLSDQKLSLPSHLSLYCSTVEKMPLIRGAFSKEDEKWCGTDFKISGTLSEPKEDLKDKLAKQAIIGVIEQLIDKQKK